MIDIVLGLIAAGVCVAFLGVLLWAFLKPSDRIQASTACLFISACVCLGAAAKLHGDGAVAGGIAVGLYGVLLYLVMGVLAISYMRWAWIAAIAAFSLHVVVGLAAGFVGLANGAVALMGMAGTASGWWWPCWVCGPACIPARVN